MQSAARIFQVHLTFLKCSSTSPSPALLGVGAMILDRPLDPYFNPTDAAVASPDQGVTAPGAAAAASTLQVHPNT